MAILGGFDPFPCALTICTPEGIITYMNAAAETLFAKHGGRALIGSNVLDCHPAAAREKLETLMREQGSNIYTTEKNGIKRLVYQFPWYQDGTYAFYAELSFEVPLEIPIVLRQ